MAAQVQENKDGTFSSVIDVTDMTYEELEKNDLIGGSDNEVMADPEADPVPDIATPLPDPEVDLSASAVPDDIGNPVPFANVDSDLVFTVQNWQVNLASNRKIGEHYLIWGVRNNSGSSYRYWDYYCAIGSDITYSSDLYTYTNVDLYHYANRDGSVMYEVASSSGTVNGEQYLVYSDLYFDYVGESPEQPSFYIAVVFFFIIIFLLVGVMKRV